WTALRIAPETVNGIRDYLGNDTLSLMDSPGALFASVLLVVISVFSFGTAADALVGGINASQAVDAGLVIAGALLGLIALRTVWAFYRRDKRVWAWSQWILLALLFFGFAALFKGVVDSFKNVSGTRTGITGDLAGTLGLLAPGLVLFFSSY